MRAVWAESFDTPCDGFLSELELCVKALSLLVNDKNFCSVGFNRR